MSDLNKRLKQFEGGTLPERIVAAILDDLNGRSGFDDIWGSLDRVTQEQIIDEWLGRLTAIMGAIMRSLGIQEKTVDGCVAKVFAMPNLSPDTSIPDSSN